MLASGKTIIAATARRAKSLRQCAQHALGIGSEDKTHPVEKKNQSDPLCPGIPQKPSPARQTAALSACASPRNNSRRSGEITPIFVTSPRPSLRFSTKTQIFFQQRRSRLMRVLRLIASQIYRDVGAVKLQALDTGGSHVLSLSISHHISMPTKNRPFTAATPMRTDFQSALHCPPFQRPPTCISTVFSPSPDTLTHRVHLRRSSHV